MDVDYNKDNYETYALWNGYFCQYCGTWVSFGTWHTCFGCGISYSENNRFIQALERIADALEKLAEKEKVK